MLLCSDIACRSLLFDGAKVVVSGFSLSCNLRIGAGDRDELYDAAMTVGPVPWMAPESMVENPSMRQFSTKSDVYMFGVLLFEIFTFGAQPWAGVRPMEIISRVRDVSSQRQLLLLHPLYSAPLVYSTCCDIPCNLRRA